MINLVISVISMIISIHIYNRQVIYFFEYAILKNMLNLCNSGSVSHQFSFYRTYYYSRKLSERIIWEERKYKKGENKKNKQFVLLLFKSTLVNLFANT